MIYIYFFLFSFFSIFAFGLVREHKIVAKVDSEVITQDDVSSHVLLLSVLKGKKREEFLKNSILDDLILVKIKRKYAKQVGLSVSQSDLDRVVAKIANSKTEYRGGMKKMLSFYDSTGVLYNHFVSDIESEILWSKVVQGLILPRISVLDNELDLLEAGGMDRDAAFNYLKMTKAVNAENELISKIRKTVVIQKF